MKKLFDASASLVVLFALGCAAEAVPSVEPDAAAPPKPDTPIPAPAPQPEQYPEWKARAAEHYDGEIIIGDDLTTFTI